MGIAQDRGADVGLRLAGDDRVRFVGTEEVRLEYQAEGGGSVVVLRRYSTAG